MHERFAFRFDPAYRRAAAVFGVKPDSAYVDVVDGSDRPETFEARYGPWVVRTPIANVVGAIPTGPYSTAKTIGPAHVSLVDGGLTFASNGDRGLCIHFRNSVPGIAPISIVRHPSLTVTVDDVEGLARALAV